MLRTSNATNILMELRKICQHPYLSEPEMENRSLPPDEQNKLLIDASGKLLFLKQLLARLKARGHRVLLFSQFKIALDIVEDFLYGEGYSYLRLDGDTNQMQRQKDMDRFNAPDSDVFIFLLTTRAGGVGVNLASADTVIIFDPDFNPQMDIQAISRSHRYGQHKRVLVFRLMMEDSVEARILNSGKRKMVLDHLVVQQMGKDSEEGEVDNMILYGAEEIRKADEHDDSAARRWTPQLIDDLIDGAEKEAEELGKRMEEERLQRENGTVDPAEQKRGFSFAKVWETNSNALKEIDDNDTAAEPEVDENAWISFIAAAEREQADQQRRQTDLHRFRTRKRKGVKYNFEDEPEEKQSKGKKTSKAVQMASEHPSDGEFVAPTGEESDTSAVSDSSIHDLSDANTGKRKASNGLVSGKVRLTKHEQQLLQSQQQHHAQTQASDSTSVPTDTTASFPVALPEQAATGMAQDSGNQVATPVTQPHHMGETRGHLPTGIATTDVRPQSRPPPHLSPLPPGQPPSHEPERHSHTHVMQEQHAYAHPSTLQMHVHHQGWTEHPSRPHRHDELPPSTFVPVSTIMHDSPMTVREISHQLAVYEATGGQPQPDIGTSQQTGEQPQQTGGQRQHTLPQHPGGQPQHPGGQPQYPGGQLQYPGGQPQYPGGQSQYLGGPAQLQYHAGQPQHPGRQPQHPGGQPHYAGGQPHYAGGQPHYAGGQPHYAGGQPHYAGEHPQHAGPQPQSAPEQPHFSNGQHQPQPSVTPINNSSGQVVSAREVLLNLYRAIQNVPRGPTQRDMPPPERIRLWGIAASNKRADDERWQSYLRLAPLGDRFLVSRNSSPYFLKDSALNTIRAFISSGQPLPQIQQGMSADLNHQQTVHDQGASRHRVSMEPPTTTAPSSQVPVRESPSQQVTPTEPVLPPVNNPNSLQSKQRPGTVSSNEHVVTINESLVTAAPDKDQPRGAATPSTQISRSTSRPSSDGGNRTIVLLSSNTPGATGAQPDAAPNAIQLGDSARFQAGGEAETNTGCCYWCQGEHVLRDCPSLVPEAELEEYRATLEKSVMDEEDKRKGLEAINFMFEAHAENRRKATKKRSSTSMRNGGPGSRQPVDSDSDNSRRKRARANDEYQPFQGCRICGSETRHPAANCPVVRAGPDSIRAVLRDRIAETDSIHPILTAILRAQEATPTERGPTCPYCGQTESQCGLSLRKCIEKRGDRRELKNKIRKLEQQREKDESMSEQLHHERDRLDVDGATLSEKHFKNAQITAVDERLANVKSLLHPLYATYLAWPNPRSSTVATSSPSTGGKRG